MKKKMLTGIKPTGTPHLGNYFAAIRPAIEQQDQYEGHFFIANLHALNTVPKREELVESTYKVAAVWLSLGLDPNKTLFWKQSDVNEVIELMWYLASFSSFGLLSRAHSFKDAKNKSKEVNMGLFNYPLLMASDILLFNTELVPVGKDQKQHVEIARDIAVKFNNAYGEILTLPEPIIEETTAIVPGVDGQKMSKSYNNVIPIFEKSKKLRKMVMKIVTDSKELEDVKDPDESIIYQLYTLVANQEQQKVLRDKYLQGGYGYGHAKQDLFESLEEYFGKARDEYFKLMDDRNYLDRILAEGAQKARERCEPLMKEIRSVVGVSV